MRGKDWPSFLYPPGLWRTEFLAVPGWEPPGLRAESDVAPLLRILDEYERYVVALVDKEKARLLSVFAGEIEETDALRTMCGPSTIRVRCPAKVPGPSRGARAVASQTGSPSAWPISIGAGASTASPRRAGGGDLRPGPPAPRALAHRVIAVMPGEMFASDGRSWTRPRGRAGASARVRGAPAPRVVDNAGPAGRSDRGCPSDARRALAGLVQTPGRAQGAQGAGSGMSNCARLDPGTETTCPTCGAAMRPEHDLSIAPCSARWSRPPRRGDGG